MTRRSSGSEGQTVGEWLRAAQPPAPERLAARVAGAIGAGEMHAVADAPDVCLDAASSLLRDVVARPTAGRESALDLLAVDALVTYAFEAAADTPETVRQRALGAIAQLAIAGARAQ